MTSRVPDQSRAALMLLGAVVPDLVTQAAPNAGMNGRRRTE